MSGRRERLEVLDAARFVAALMVVGFHWTFNGINNGKIIGGVEMPVINRVTRFGFWGVTFFFLISGFVISYSVTGKTARQYVVSRLTRLYPAFWVAVLLTGSVLLVANHPKMPVSVPQILVNLTMVPTVFGVPFVDGVYWTLAYELVFYLIVLAVMLVFGAERLERVVLVWLGLMLIAAVVAVTAGTDVPAILGRPFPAFAVGAILSAIVHGGGSPLRWIAVIAGAGLMVHQEIGYSAQLALMSGVSYPAWMVTGLMLSFVGVLVIQVFPRVRAVRVPAARLLGNLTYPLYLLHAHLGYLALSRWGNPAALPWLYVPLLGAVLLLSWLLHVIVERAPRRAWKALFDRTGGALVDRLQRLVDLVRSRLAARRS